MSIAALALLDQTGVRTVNRNMLADLRQQVAGLECAGQVMKGAVALGVPEIDRDLPDGGLAGGAVHEVLGGAVTGFAALIAARLEGPVLWCLDASRREDPYGPGLKALGFKPERLVLARCRGLREMLWTMEEGLRSTAPSLVIAEPGANIGLVESRRLQLAAEAGGTLGLILRDDGEVGRLVPSAVASRWQVDPASGGGWHLTLKRCRGAMISRDEWKVKYNDATGCLALVAEAGDRPGATGDRLCPV
jgi:protein ImuA